MSAVKDYTAVITSAKTPCQDSTAHAIQDITSKMITLFALVRMTTGHSSKSVCQ